MHNLERDVADKKYSSQVVTFRVGNLLMGVDALRVQEIIRSQDFTIIPLASPHIKGLINLRGQIVTAVDLRIVLKLSEEKSESLMNLVLPAEEGIVSLMVDSIGEVVEVLPDFFLPVPDNLSDSLRDVLEGVSIKDAELLLLLDTTRLLPRILDSVS